MTNKEQLNKANRAYYARNKQKLTQLKRDKYANGYRATALQAQKQYRNDPKNKEVIRKSKQKWKLKQSYNLTPEQYEALFTAQNGCCAICGVNRMLLQNNLSVDHDHSCCSGDKSCGKCIRGLLCMRCNSAIGLLQDNANIIRKAAQYIEDNNVIQERMK
jgi:hypothetical protein